MAIRAVSLVNVVQQALESANINRGKPTIVAATSKITADNKHRLFYERIKTEFLHYDADHRERIIYSLNEYVASQSDTDQELIVVLERIVEMAQSIRDINQVPVSPVKKIVPTTDKSTPRDLGKVVRNLLNQFDQ